MIVLDDLYAISDIRLKDAYYQRIQEWMERNDLWVVLISRAPFPAWLLSLRMKYSFVMIGEEDFCLTREQQDEYLERYGLQVSEEQLEKAWAVGRGNPMSLRIFVMENGNLEATMRTVWTYLEVMYMISGIQNCRNFLWIFPLSRFYGESGGDDHRKQTCGAYAGTGMEIGNFL